MIAYTASISEQRGRRFLRYQAYIWRFLARIAFYVHNFARPRPPSPSFYHTFTTKSLDDATSPPTTLRLAVYVPANHSVQTKIHGRKYPVVVLFHGGGFTMGTVTDDARWAAMVVDEVDAVVVSVCYRLAPEHPFPTAVEDGVEAVLFIAAHADVFGVDISKMALSGFSAGGNLAFTVSLRLREYILSMQEDHGESEMPFAIMPLPRLVSVVAWYPSLDNRLTRAQRRASCPRPDKTLPPILTNLLDGSYFPDPRHKASIFASPAAASDEMLLQALPDTLGIFLCEWDMLLQEGKDFAEKLEGLGKQVSCTVIKGRRHGFDKTPNPFKLDPTIGLHYRQGCDILREAFATG